MTKSKKCVFILPYFGKFNNYFPLFLKSCEKNPDFDWLIFTDCQDKYSYPNNVHKIVLTLDQVKKLAEQKFEFSVCLKSPYKMCDYKPAYGFLFEEYIKEYGYWGHCDCDLIFGKMAIFLDPLFMEGYDKIFAAGHLTLYKNTPENNRRFMKPLNGHYLYKKAYTTNDICVFDEDCAGHDNVHSIFLKDGVKVYENDLSMNLSTRYAKFVRAYYDPAVREFVTENYRKARYYWDHGNILRIEQNGNSVASTSFLYLHLQLRKMRIGKGLDEIIEILPDRFVASKKIPETKKELRIWTIGFPYLYWLDVYIKRIGRKLTR